MSEDKHRYSIIVWGENAPYDDEDEPMVNGVVDLTDQEEQDLTARLDRFEAEGVIGQYNIERYEEPAVFAIEGVYRFITGDIEAKDETLRALWEGTAS